MVITRAGRFGLMGWFGSSLGQVGHIGASLTEKYYKAFS
jgi:hypothetical protein